MGKTAKRNQNKDSKPASAATDSASLEEELERAEIAIRNSQFKVNSIHKQWKTYLQRLSYMVLLISIHQMRSPTTACLKDAKQFNQVLEARTLDGDDMTLITGKKVVLLVLADSMVHLLAICMAACLSFFLIQQQPPPDPSLSPAAQQEQMTIQAQTQAVFANPRYLLSNACIPPMLALYFGHQKKQSDASVSSCLEPHLLVAAGVTPEPRERSLPIVLVFHVIVTACIWFMDMQQNQVYDNVKKLHTLRSELSTAQTQAKSKKKQ
uniref:Uncharacterized protein n=1 Tax=Entomoneis paludosa TaxID=265537 RepID=A0A7S2VFT6_9STRA